MMFRKRRSITLLILGLLLLIILSLFTAFAAVNGVPSIRMDEVSENVNPNDLKPSECNSISLSTIVNIANGDSPTAGNDLILGTGSQDAINGLGGDDCILGGDKNDNLFGGEGDDVIIGGPNKDSVVGGDGYDTCYGGGGPDKARDFDCEVVNIP